MAVDIHGKLYSTVAERLQTMKNEHPEYTLETELLRFQDGGVIMKATLQFDGRVFNGHDHERYDDADSFVNATSALENAETSAVGRALALAGYAGTEIASAEEVTNAIQQREDKPPPTGSGGRNPATGQFDGPNPATPRKNRHPGDCVTCGKEVASEEGYLERDKDGKYIVFCAKCYMGKNEQKNDLPDVPEPPPLMTVEDDEDDLLPI